MADDVTHVECTILIRLGSILNNITDCLEVNQLVEYFLTNSSLEFSEDLITLYFVFKVTNIVNNFGPVALPVFLSSEKFSTNETLRVENFFF